VNGKVTGQINHKSGHLKLKLNSIGKMKMMVHFLFHTSLIS